MTMQLIQRIELGANQASISFASIPQTFTDLLIFSSLRGTDNNRDISAAVNGSTSNLVSYRLAGNGSNAFSEPSTNTFVECAQNSYTANTFSNTSIYIPNYTLNSNKSMSIDEVIENNATEGQQRLISVVRNISAAITSITFTKTSGSFVTGSSMTLYGITAGSSGGVVVS